MQNKVSERRFDPEEYVNERLLEIQDATERKQLRTIMNSFFSPFYQYMEEKYEKLEQRMLEKTIRRPLLTSLPQSALKIS